MKRHQKNNKMIELSPITDSPRVAIIVLNWNGWQDTIECLESVLRNDYPNYQVIVVDNNSPNNSMEYIKAWAEGKQEVLTPEPTHPLYYLSHPPVKKPIPYVEYDRKTAETGGIPEKEKLLYNELPKGIPHPLILIQTGDNLGFAGGNNVGIRYALARDDFEYVWLLNNDTVIERSTLVEMVNLAKSDRKVGIIGSKLLYYDNPNIIQAVGGGKISKWSGVVKHIGYQKEDNGQWNKVIDVDYVTGASMLVRKKVIEKVGLMDETYFLYCEESDWCLRIKNYGWKLLYCPTSRAWHKEGGTIGYKSPLAEYYLSRNSLTLWKRFYPKYLLSAFLIQLMGKTINRIRRKQPKNLWYIIRGYIDFLKGKKGKL